MSSRALLCTRLLALVVALAVGCAEEASQGLDGGARDGGAMPDAAAARDAAGAQSDATDTDAADTDAAAPDSGTTIADATTPAPDASAPDSGASAPDGGRTFLDPADYADVLTFDAAFPFGVTARHRADGPMLGARWGRHGGPMATTDAYQMPNGMRVPAVVRWSIPADPRGDATSVQIPFVAASGLPARFFYGADGMIDLPFGPLALLSYTEPSAPYPGEALLYAVDYDRVVSRAFVNGFYSGAGFGNDGLVFSALSALHDDVTGMNANGLYVAEICGASLIPMGSCSPSVQVFGWQGASGPVVLDAEGSAFVAASVSRPGVSDVVMAVDAAALATFAAATPATLVEANTQGTSSLAAVAPRAGQPGWIVARGFGGRAPDRAYAQAYRSAGGLAPQGARVDGAIVPARGLTRYSMFTSDDGALWIAAELTNGSWFLRAEPL